MSTIDVQHVTKIFPYESEIVRRHKRVPAPVLDEERQPVEGRPTPEGILALDDVTLHIRHGETLAVIGPSGCGKTTLLRVIAGLEKPTSGRVLFDRQDMTNVPPGDRGVGIVFQNYALYPHRTSKGNLSFYFEVHHRENEIEEKVKQTAKALGVGFEQLLDKKPDVLSAGQRQRVALGRCIIRDPTLILLDEPLSNLDAKLRVTTRTELKRLLHRYQVTCVYVTHDQTEAIALGDHLAVMRAGRIEQTGTFWDIYHRPRNAFVAGFVGMPPMNFFPVRFTPNTVLAEGWERPLPRPHNRYLPSGGTALMGVRPEHVHACPSDAPGAHMVTVEGLEYHPADRVYIIHSHIGERPLVGRAPSDHTYRIGEQLTMAPLMDEAFFFDPVTEERIY